MMVKCTQKNNNKSMDNLNEEIKFIFTDRDIIKPTNKGMILL